MKKKVNHIPYMKRKKEKITGTQRKRRKQERERERERGERTTKAEKSPRESLAQLKREKRY